jgi:uncharacterized protein DUF5522
MYKQEEKCDPDEEPAESPSEGVEIVEGVDYYLENGLLVFTEHFLVRRGCCCESGCRHCPYGYKVSTTAPK